MRTLLLSVGLALASLLFTLGALELAVRLKEGKLGSTDHHVLASQKRKAVPQTRHDPRLGWTPTPGYRGIGRDWRWRYDSPANPGTHQDATISILEHGIRSNGVEPPLRPWRILAVGDSFTFGDRVSDGDSWPAGLERALGVGVANGGVYGYGLDQSVLRAEQLASLLGPELLVVGFIRADIFRTIQSTRGAAAKPYFQIEDGRLVLRNVPVPEPLRELDPFRRVLGYSYLADFVMGRVAPAYWYQGPLKRVAGDADAISCLLMDRLVGLAPVVLVVAQQSRADELDTARVDRVLACARANGLATLSLFPDLFRLAETQPERHTRFYENHMTPEGNAFVAERIAAHIRREGWLAAGGE